MAGGRLFLLMLGVLAVLVPLGCRRYAKPPAYGDSFKGAVDRYQLAVGDGALYKIDTTNGDVWIYLQSADGRFYWESSAGITRDSRVKTHDFIRKTGEISEEEYKRMIEQLEERLREAQGR